MMSKKIDDRYILRLDRGEKIIENIKGFCTKNNIKLGYFFFPKNQNFWGFWGIFRLFFKKPKKK